MSSAIDCGPYGNTVSITDSITVCICNKGYIPSTSEYTCEAIENVCTMGTFCFNDGKCVQDFSNRKLFKCECLPKFSGEYCQWDASICDIDNPCLNKGICVPDNSNARNYTCSCVNNFSGKNCEIPQNVGIGRIGLFLDSKTLIGLWILWICFTLTFLYCSGNMIAKWVKTRWGQKVVQNAL